MSGTVAQCHSPKLFSIGNYLFVHESVTDRNLFGKKIGGAAGVVVKSSQSKTSTTAGPSKTAAAAGEDATQDPGPNPCHFGALYVMPLLFLNMLGEMIYVLKQRLDAQQVESEKGLNILCEVLEYALSENVYI